MKLNRKIITLFSGTLVAASLNSCTNLDEKLLAGRIQATDGGTTPTISLSAVYAKLNDFAGTQEKMYAMSEHPSDEMMGPTRGTDWDDFGTWRKLHQHTWDPTHDQLLNAWNDFHIGAFRATLVIASTTATTQEKAEARFLRAFYQFYLIDAFGKLPVREATDATETNPKVLTRKEAVSYIITELETALKDLSSLTSTSKASKEAGNALLAKLYLNKAVYEQDPNSPSGPFTFAAADMNKVIAACDAVIASGKFSLQPAGKYYQNFYWDNTADSKEIIFGIDNSDANQRAGNISNRVNMSLHYNQGGHDQANGGAWNGFTTLADFYSGFEAGDERLGGAISGYTDKVGLRFGLLKGQQYNWDGSNVKTRGGQPLVFTETVNLGFANENEGIRVNKFIQKPGKSALAPFPFSTDGSISDNDAIFFRYADIVLMKAEAIHRGGTATSGDTKESLLNKIRTLRGLTALTASGVTDKSILAERGHELYWEGWRRQDQIRFGTFLDPVDQRATKSDAYKVVFPIPLQAVTSNPNLTQNVGY